MTSECHMSVMWCQFSWPVCVISCDVYCHDQSWSYEGHVMSIVMTSESHMTVIWYLMSWPVCVIWESCGVCYEHIPFFWCIFHVQRRIETCWRGQDSLRSVKGNGYFLQYKMLSTMPCWEQNWLDRKRIILIIIIYMQCEEVMLYSTYILWVKIFAIFANSMPFAKIFQWKKIWHSPASSNSTAYSRNLIIKNSN